MRSHQPSPTGRLPGRAHSAELLAAFDRMLDPLPVRRHELQLHDGKRVHVVEAGGGPAAVFLHGTNTNVLSFVPLLTHLTGLRVLAVDRPGRGCSDPAPVPRERTRDAAVEFLDGVLDELGEPSPTFVGQSGGGVWALWYALARPERVRAVVLLGSTPLLPGTRCPAPLRVAALPMVGAVLGRLLRPTPKRFLQLMRSIGEADTVVRYPDLIAAMVAGANDPVAAAADRAELRALIGPLGFRAAMRFRADQLASVGVPVLLIWGDHDPVGSVEVAQAAARQIPDARLEVLAAGHVPQLGHPALVAALIDGFVRSAPVG